MNCPDCHHDSHDGRMCGHYNTITFRDDVGYGVKPTGKTSTLIESVCSCVRLMVWTGEVVRP